MSEVDRLSNSGLYPALPIEDRRPSPDDKERGQRRDQGSTAATSKSADTPNTPRPPKSLIDEYA
jgi:hypothetical protein